VEKEGKIIIEFDYKMMGMIGDVIEERRDKGEIENRESG
jgi:hypothetical protein